MRGGKGEGKKNTVKQARPSSSTTDEFEEDARRFEDLLTLYKALEQEGAEKSVHVTGLQPLLQTADNEIKVLNDKVAALKASLQFTQQEQGDIKDCVAHVKKTKLGRRQN